MINLVDPHISDYDDVIAYEYAIRKLHRTTFLHDAYKWARVFASKHRLQSPVDFDRWTRK